jgi:transposase
VGSIFKYGDRRVRALLYRGALASKEWALGTARRSTMRKAHVALTRWLAIIMHAMLWHDIVFQAA